VGHGLHHHQRVLDAMVEFVDQQFKLLLELLAFGDVDPGRLGYGPLPSLIELQRMIAPKHPPRPARRFEAILDRQFRLRRREVAEHAAHVIAILPGHEVP
jgi:hypothetical protein